LDFLGLSPFRYENPDYEGWISLDFLGFSGPNRAFSTSYKRFSVENFSLQFFPLRSPRGEAHIKCGVRKPGACSSGELSLFSDFLQEIVADTLSQGPSLNFVI
jgi:hypothetical protein